MANFIIAEQKTKKIEGGYVNNPNDTGKETLNGISRKWWPLWAGWVILDQIKKRVGLDPRKIDIEVKNNKVLQNLIIQFYKTNFWDINKLDLISNQSIANEIYDSGVNIGTDKVAFMLQEACNLTNIKGAIYKDIAVDGKIGAQTIGTVNKHPRKELLYKVLNCLQAEHYIKILRNNPSQEVFANSWFSRVDFYFIP